MSNLINSLSTCLLKMLSLEENRDELTTLSRRTFSFQDGTGGFYFLDYKVHHALLISLKYADERAVARILRPLYSALRELRMSTLTSDEKMYLVPIPQSRLRVLKRGFNQTRRLLGEMMRLDKDKLFYFETNNLIKIRETKKQALLSRAERLVAQKGVFKVQRPKRIKGRTVLLFDDIVTT
ncbi:MAG: hypothetical protein WDZ74_00685, partial [Candidatus Paceibacterota bacterium]